MTTYNNYRLAFIVISLCIAISACSSDAGEASNSGSDGVQPAPLAEPEANLPSPSSAPDRIYAVSPDGSDTADGSEASPWATIQHAVDTAEPGSAIFVQSGTYAGARIERSGTNEAWLTLQAAPGANVLIDTPGPNNRHDSILEIETWEGDETVAYWVIEGLEIANAPNWGIDVRGSESGHSHDFVIRNNLVHDNGLDSGTTGIFTAFVDNVTVTGNESYGNGEHGIYLSNSGDNFVVRGNLLHDNVNCGLHINGDLESGEDGIISDGLVENNVIYENGEEGCSGINMDGVTNAIVRNNLLYQNHAGGISLFQENGAICTQNVQILNNTIVQAEDGRWAINISDDECVNNKIFNNIILTYHEWRGSIVIPSSDISGFESDYNIIMDRFSADDDDSVITLAEWQALGYDTNSIIASPDAMFVGSNDFHLRPDSPAVDAGMTLTNVDTDLEGTSRPQDTYDIGAFELGGAPSAQPPAEQPADPDTAVAVPEGGTITYTFDGRVYRIDAQENAVPEDLSSAFDQLAPGTGDVLLNISPDGEWLVVETERFDPECDGWSCLAIAPADLSSAEVLRSDGQVIHPEGLAAVGSGGDLVVFPNGEGPHEGDLWSIFGGGSSWSAPILLTADSPHAYNTQPAISDDGTKVVFMCGPEPYGGEGTEICEVNTDGTGFHVVLTPNDAPSGFSPGGALYQPDYAPDGSLVFEADWGAEQIWRLPVGSTEAVVVNSSFSNDNSPCVLPDGRIVSLWLERPGGSGLHEIKVMQADGSSFFILLPDVDIQDIGMGCGA